VIIDPVGIILTNNHVVHGADDVIVELKDGRQFKATDIKRDERSDLAVLWIKAPKGLPAAKLGNSDKLETGDWVLAFGSPFGLEQTVSAGIIKRTTLQVVVRPLPGDFGVAARPSPGGDPQGDDSGFRADKLGLQVGELTGPVAERLGFKGFSGVVVTGVEPDGLAAWAGIREGMLILRVGKQPVKSVAEFKAALKDQSVKEGVLLLVRTQQGNRFVVLQGSR